MSLLLWTVLAALALVALASAYWYNRLVRLRNRCRESWSNVDTELKRRHNLVPNLVKVVQGHARHEARLMQEITEARTRAMRPHEGAAAQQADEQPLVGALRSLFAVAEGYPQLKASQSFLQLQRELAITEDRIQAARRFYNANVRDYRNISRTFPGLLFARAFRFAQEQYFQIDPLLVDPPRVPATPGSEARA